MLFRSDTTIILEKQRSNTNDIASREQLSSIVQSIVVYIGQRWYHSHRFQSNVNTIISVQCKENFAIVFYNYAVQQRY